MSELLFDNELEKHGIGGDTRSAVRLNSIRTIELAVISGAHQPRRKEPSHYRIKVLLTVMILDVVRVQRRDASWKSGNAIDLCV
jgi:hypothetical protein